ncbi:hypoxanthine-guanine phosphoribosyltransferase [Lapidilactobacillus concavus DSM 17758]|uniref:Hypoxanthine phosphoribosyltransferase n=1 Tax=Lapidilactobacillus concavus DSM 17758 TaxID=1423735 RepID=A0A0R1VSD6_9LACO|nr:hypoxanthine phosphoribosyltransferase [Lapidilactobacillus concavus]KRM08673.1 hypoxanthine-guanine phosphoribosyltransferase [Lapidilactobacillus concavus DSM 17758]GEL13106.1 hypoxanthine phosphoribosyltransferase [Lapidilactobacillus concavus]
MREDIEKVIVSTDQIHEIVERLGKQLHDDYRDKNPIFICILKGAVIFMTDLIRAYDDLSEIEFMDVSSYGDAFESSGEVRIIKDLDVPVNGRHIVIVEDIIDTGRTLAALIKLLDSRGAASIKICSLLSKEAHRLINVHVDYIGVEVPDEFLVGYGLDYKNQYRNLPFIGVLKPKIYE